MCGNIIMNEKCSSCFFIFSLSFPFSHALWYNDCSRGLQLFHHQKKNFSRKKKVLDKYKLEEFKPLVDGIRKGDLRTFQDGLVKYQDRFIRYVMINMISILPVKCFAAFPFFW